MCREYAWNGCHASTVTIMGVWPPTTAFAGGGCKPVYAADIRNGSVVNDTFKRQFKLSGENKGDDRKGTVEEASKPD